MSAEGQTYDEEALADRYLRQYGDARSECPEDSTPTLYAHYGVEGDLLYVGMTVHSRRRQLRHKRESHWKDKIASVKFWAVRDELWLSRIETIAISEWGPRYNGGAR